MSKYPSFLEEEFAAEGVCNEPVVDSVSGVVVARRRCVRVGRFRFEKCVGLMKDVYQGVSTRG